LREREGPSLKGWEGEGLLGGATLTRPSLTRRPSSPAVRERKRSG
jgi:hypothetical protein